MDKEKSTFRKSGVKTETIKEKVLEKLRKECYFRIVELKNGVTTYFIKTIDLTIQECSKERDSLIDEAREIMLVNKKQTPTNRQINISISNLITFGFKIAEEKKSGEKELLKKVPSKSR